MENLKIKAVNAPNFIRHLELISRLSTRENESPYPFDLWKELIRLERKAHKITAAQMNEQGDEAKQDKELGKILTKVNKMLKIKTLFINYDSRGFALKISEEEAKELQMYKDLGGYGILTPQF